MRWFRKKDHPEHRIVLPVEDGTGKIIGEITFDSDGSFAGMVRVQKFRENLEAASRHGMVINMQMVALIQHPTPPWKRK